MKKTEKEQVEEELIALIEFTLKLEFKLKEVIKED